MCQGNVMLFNCERRGGLNLYIEVYSAHSICAPLSQHKNELARTSHAHLSWLEMAQ